MFLDKPQVVLHHLAYFLGLLDNPSADIKVLQNILSFSLPRPKPLQCILTVEPDLEKLSESRKLVCQSFCFCQVTYEYLKTLREAGSAFWLAWYGLCKSPTSKDPDVNQFHLLGVSQVIIECWTGKAHSRCTGAWPCPLTWCPLYPWRPLGPCIVVQLGPPPPLRTKR